LLSLKYWKLWHFWHWCERLNIKNLQCKSIFLLFSNMCWYDSKSADV
jgi:hypothetical protein